MLITCLTVRPRSAGKRSDAGKPTDLSVQILSSALRGAPIGRSGQRRARTKLSPPQRRGAFNKSVRPSLSRT